MIELVKRRQVKINTMIGPWVCEKAGVYFMGEPDDILYPELQHPGDRGYYVKCRDCMLKGKKNCQKIACLASERRDGQSIIFTRG